MTARPPAPADDQRGAAERDARQLLDERAAAGVRVVDPRHVELAEWVAAAFERHPPDDICPHVGAGSSPRVVRGSFARHRRPVLWCQPCAEQLDHARALLGLAARYRCDRCTDLAVDGAVPAAVVLGAVLVDVALCPGCAGDFGLTPSPAPRHDGGPSTPTPITRRTP